MATPDLSTLTSSAQIFSSNYTLPQIRAIHKSLHVEIDEKASRLRTQVGSSYRDLLGTADTIVQMRKDNDAVQGVLGRMGGRCGRGVVGSKVSGLSKFESNITEQSRADVGVVARARLLEACGLVLGRVLKGSGAGSLGLSRGDRLVLASKVLVLSRLLTKSLEEEKTLNGDVGYAVEAAKKSLAGSKKRLLRNIKGLLERAGDSINQQDVLKALCAHSLATSSGASDVLTLFLGVRKSAMAMAFEAEDNERQGGTGDILKSLNLYTKTLLDVQALVPFKLSDALSNLKKNPLLADPSLKKLENLRLDIYERWCGEDIQCFTPFIRHDDLDGPQARDMLFDWADKSGKVLVNGLKKTMERMMDFKSITELRTSVLQLWIREGGKARGFDPSEMLDELRSAINGHMLHVLEIKVNKLHLIGSEVTATLDSWQDGVTDQPISLWDVRSFDIDLINGADHFLQELVARLHGRNDSVSKAVNAFHSWRQIIDEVGHVVEQLKKQRWDNDIDEIEDEETIEERQQLLSKDDPKMLHEQLDSNLVKAFKSLDEKLTSLWQIRADAPNSGKVAMYLLRILRDVRQGLPKLDAVKDFGLTVVPSLHEKLAQSVAANPLQIFATKALTQNVVLARPLWEGSPELPTQPSPRVFRFLKDVSTEMGDAGMDLWSAVAVSVMKQHLRKQIGEKWLEALATYNSEGTNVDGDNEKPEASSEYISEKAEVKESAEGSDENEDEKPSEEKEDENITDKESKVDEQKDGEDKEEDKTEEAEKKPKEDEATTSAAVSEMDDVAQQRRDLFIQWLFDISLLGCYLDASSETKGDEFKDLKEKIYERTGLDSSEARQRITKSSQEYHKKTSLLFGLLSS
ncbi:sphingolipid c9-methyltransferase [Colletotrichum truncatum]|uniref:Sphingolipid c9-methyltransferase n=1 Tax=Colletotrichum truncatum TaxID=5467 RepID=A0ACC3YGR1_COLTU|nr:sphingolipid c9-methyltransferase [Colletotrichum truncatum]KAF6784047.1 sphingolipid c9-methyltransferase [Colletotrichum truncatum]